MIKFFWPSQVSITFNWSRDILLVFDVTMTQLLYISTCSYFPTISSSKNTSKNTLLYLIFPPNNVGASFSQDLPEEVGHTVQLPCVQSTLKLTNPHSPDFRFNGILLQLDKVLGPEKMSVGCKENSIGGVAGDCFPTNTNNTYKSIKLLHQCHPITRVILHNCFVLSGL